jgi:hypothetical protein
MPAPLHYQAPPVAQPRSKRSRTPLIIGAAVAAVIVVALGAFFAVGAITEANRSARYDEAVALMDHSDYASALGILTEIDDYKDATGLIHTCESWLAFDEAVALMENGEYQAALDAFNALGDFARADEKASQCRDALDFREGMTLYETGAYADAATIFASLAASGFSEAGEWHNKTRYAIAGEAFDSGDHYAAYQLFSELGSYGDAADRATGCTTPYPGNGELFHDGGFYSSACDMTIEAGSASQPHYIKIYSEDTLVSTMFINAGGAATISLPAGSYTFKAATGTLWFGDSVMFGADGDYAVLIFDNGNDYAGLENNYTYTITLVTDGGGNVGQNSVSPESF